MNKLAVMSQQKTESKGIFNFTYMDFSLHLVLIDAKTREIWQTPNHNGDKRKDDYHRDIKPIIIRRLSNKLKKRFGVNCNIEISNGEIFIVSQKFDKETGKRLNSRTNANLNADEFFQKISKLLFVTILKEINILNFENIHIIIDKSKENIVTFIVELEIKEK